MKDEERGIKNEAWGIRNEGSRTVLRRLRRSSLFVLTLIKCKLKTNTGKEGGVLLKKCYGWIFMGAGAGAGEKNPESVKKRTASATLVMEGWAEPNFARSTPAQKGRFWLRLSTRILDLLIPTPVLQKKVGYRSAPLRDTYNVTLPTGPWTFHKNDPTRFNWTSGPIKVGWEACDLAL